MASADVENKRSLLERLQDNYRLVVIDDDDLKEVNTFKFNLLTLYILLSTLLVLIGALAVALIFFTPIKRMIPGFAVGADNSQYIEMRRKVDELEELMQAQEAYNKGISNLLKGSASPGDVPQKTETGNNTAEETTAKPMTTVNTASMQEASKTKELNQLVFASPLSGTVSAKFDPEIEHFG